MTQIQGDPAQPGARSAPDKHRIETGRTETIIPVWQEELHVDTRTVDTGKGIRIHKTVTEEEVIVDPALMQEQLSVEHVTIGQWVEPGKQPEMRYEGDTLVVPVLEEVLVIEKKLRLKEELRITRRRQETRVPQSVVLRTEKVAVERFDRAGEPADGDASGKDG
jgi:stress response protein YsnF